MAAAKPLPAASTPVLRVAAAWGIEANGTVLWRGEKPRPTPASPDGWTVQSIAA